MDKSVFEQLSDAKFELKSLEIGVKSADSEAVERAKELIDEIIPALEEQVAKATAQQEILAKIEDTDADVVEESPNMTAEEKSAQTLGAKAAEAVAAKGYAKGERVQAKAATDVHATVDVAYTDKTVSTFVDDDDILSLFNVQTIEGNAFTYFVEGAVDGDFDEVAENGLKPQVHFNYEEKTEKLAKIAAFYKETDELLQDASWLASSIDTRAIRMLRAKVRDYVIRKAAGAEGVLVVPTADGETETQKNMNTILDAVAQIKEQSGETATAVVFNPTDWANIRKGTDANGQYYAGSAYGYDYGNGHGSETFWGLQVRTSNALAKGTALVGAFYECGSIFQNNDGEQVEVANMNEDDFIHNRITIVAEKRLGAAIRKPQALAKATLA